MSFLADAFSILCLLGALFFFGAGTAGLLRFPDARSRLHALAKADHLGLGLVVLALLPRTENLGDAARLVAIWLLVLLASAATGPLLARLSRPGGPPR
jgi:multicomponent Na+:H+ antiporter subunit G